jgi:hypothetical protein
MYQARYNAGPLLWNSFLAVAAPAKSKGGEEGMFADDLKVFQQ